MFVSLRGLIRLRRLRGLRRLRSLRGLIRLRCSLPSALCPLQKKPGGRRNDSDGGVSSSLKKV